MDSHAKYFLAIFLSVFITVPFLCSATSLEKIFYMSNLMEKEGIESLKNNADKIDILAPQFYSVSAKMNLIGGLDDKLKAIIAQKKVKIMPLVTNAGFRQSVIHNLLVSATAQDEIIKSLVAEAKKENYIGWQFDFENINYLDKDLYSAFVEKTYKSFQQNRLIFSIAAVSRSVDYEDTKAFKNWGGAFDYARLARATDFISLMLYDDPDSKGPVASVLYVNKILAYVKGKIPPEKLSFGIPFYYWGWSINPQKRIRLNGTYQMVLDRISSFKHIQGFDQSLGTSWLDYFSNNKMYMIWYEDKKSFDIRLNTIKLNGFKGFSAWVLGSEDPGIWSSLSSIDK